MKNGQNNPADQVLPKRMLSLKISSIIFLFMKSKCANFA